MVISCYFIRLPDNETCWNFWLVDYYYCYLFIIHLFINLAVIVVMDLDL